MTGETRGNGDNERPGAGEGGDEADAPADRTVLKAETGGENDGESDAAPPEPSPLERLTAEREALGDQCLRLVAEMENLRRGTAQAVKAAREDSLAAFVDDMRIVAGDLRQALDAIPNEAREAGDAGLTALAEGVEMTERSMLATLERHGIDTRET